MRNPKYGAPRAKPAVPFLTPTWGDIPATRWRIPPRPKAVVSCCRDEFSGLNFSWLTNFLNAITGWNLTPQELLKTGERIVNLMHMFNIKHGLQPLRDYQLPKRFFTPHAEGGAAHVKIPFEEMVNEYYKARSWPEGKG